MGRRAASDDEVLYGPSELGQLIYDIGFAKLTDATIARKYGMTLEQVRSARAAFGRGFKAGKAEEKANAKRRRR